MTDVVAKVAEADPAFVSEVYDQTERVERHFHDSGEGVDAGDR